MHNNEELLTNPWFLLAVTIVGVIGLFQLIPHFFVAVSVLFALGATLACFIASIVSFFDERIGAGIALLILTPITALVTGGITSLVDKAAENVDRERIREKERDAERLTRKREGDQQREAGKSRNHGQPRIFTHIWIISSAVVLIFIATLIGLSWYKGDFVPTKDNIELATAMIAIVPLLLFLPSVYIAAIIEWLTERAKKI